MIKGFPSTLMDDVQLNITNMIRHTARNFPEREIVYRTPHGVTRYTYLDAYRRILRLANVLKRLGIEPADRVGVLDWNTRRQYELYYAIPGTGAVFLQMNLRISAADLTYVVNHSKARVIFVDESLLSVAEAIAPQVETVQAYVIMSDKKLSEISTRLEPTYSYEEMLAEESAEYDWPVIDEKSAYSACYTSGTTGKPKGVYYSHRGICLHTIYRALYDRMTCYDTFMQIVPMFHAQGWGQFQSATLVGAKIVLSGRWTVEDISALVDLMIAEKVTISGGAPAIFIPMLDYIQKLKDKPDFRGTRLVCGATEPPLAMMKGWKELTGAEVLHGYGATETSPLVVINFLKPSLVHKLNEEEKWELKKKQGLILSGVDLKIVDPAGKELPHDGKSVGEVQIRGPWIAGSYYNDPRTEESFVGGYWKSADAAIIDPDGYLKIADRYKDLIKSGGEWISSVDLENTIMAHPGVLEAVVVGLPHPKWEERPLALVVLKEAYKNKVTPEEILNFLKSQFVRWQLPDRIKFVKEIPKTSVGKFNKKAIRESYQDEFSDGGIGSAQR
ncbi:MAG: long-chain-fatty-acid--CoA ligase [Planctomycetaceae bacterium]